jgi:hypothetical protein
MSPTNSVPTLLVSVIRDYQRVFGVGQNIIVQAPPKHCSAEPRPLVNDPTGAFNHFEGEDGLSIWLLAADSSFMFEPPVGLCFPP